MSADFTVVPLQPCHLPEVACLEQLCFADEPWSEQSLRTLCDAHGCGVVALTDDGTVLAYGGMTYAADEGAITNIATHPGARRRGAARAVVQALLKQACERGLASLYLEVRPSNTPAIALYRSLGFEEVGRRKHFYRHPTEDALLMRAAPGDGTNSAKD